jgi:hypothetical protein
MTFSQSTLSLMALIALGLSVVATCFAIFGGSGVRRRPGSDEALRLDEALQVALEDHGGQIKRLEQAIRALNAMDRRQQVSIEGGIRKVALLRYDAFEDVGGRLSFSCALLDEYGSGVVLTSINGRQETRVYAKPISTGRSSYNLSQEEAEAIREALESVPTDGEHTGEPAKPQELEAR